MINKILRSNTLNNVLEHTISNKSPLDEPIDFAESIFVKKEQNTLLTNVIDNNSNNIKRQYFVIRGALLYWYENLEAEKQKRIILLKNVSINETKQEINIFYKNIMYNVFCRNKESFTRWKMIIMERGNNNNDIINDELYNNNINNILLKIDWIQKEFKEIKEQHNILQEMIKENKEENNFYLSMLQVKMREMENHLFILLHKIEDIHRKQIELKKDMLHNWIQCRTCLIL